MANNRVDVGPWGGNGGANPWSFILDGGRITQIKIRSGDVIDAISFVYTQNGSTNETTNFGGHNGSLSTIIIANDEEIINISGKVGGQTNLTVITQLTFVTNKATYGPFGTNGGTDFSIPISKDKVIGFFGRYGAFLDAISVVLSP